MYYKSSDRCKEKNRHGFPLDTLRWCIKSEMSNVPYGDPAMRPTLPQLSPTPTRHAQCCVSLSSGLMSSLDAALPAPPVVELTTVHVGDLAESGTDVA